MFSTFVEEYPMYVGILESSGVRGVQDLGKISVDACLDVLGEFRRCTHPAVVTIYTFAGLTGLHQFWMNGWKEGTGSGCTGIYRFMKR